MFAMAHNPFGNPHVKSCHLWSCILMMTVIAMLVMATPVIAVMRVLLVMIVFISGGTDGDGTKIYNLHFSFLKVSYSFIFFLILSYKTCIIDLKIIAHLN